MKGHNLALIATGHYAYQWTDELAASLRESVKQHMAAYGITESACSLKVEQPDLGFQQCAKCQWKWRAGAKQQHSPKCAAPDSASPSDVQGEPKC